MTILSVYQDKVRTLRKLVKEMREFAEAPDAPAISKWKILNEFQRSKIEPGLKDLGLESVKYPNHSFNDGTKLILAYISSLESLLGFQPVDVSAGRE